MKAFRNVKEAELINIPKLGKCVLAAAFKCIKKAKVENASSLGELKELADLCICVPETETFKVQELHLPVYHYLCAETEAHFFTE